MTTWRGVHQCVWCLLVQAASAQTTNCSAHITNCSATLTLLCLVQAPGAPPAGPAMTHVETQSTSLRVLLADKLFGLRALREHMSSKPLQLASLASLQATAATTLEELAGVAERLSSSLNERPLDAQALCGAAQATALQLLATITKCTTVRDDLMVKQVGRRHIHEAWGFAHTQSCACRAWGYTHTVMRMQHGGMHTHSHAHAAWGHAHTQSHASMHSCACSMGACTHAVMCMQHVSMHTCVHVRRVGVWHAMCEHAPTHSAFCSICPLMPHKGKSSVV